VERSKGHVNAYYLVSVAEARLRRFDAVELDKK
jgi:hypothetical protein